MWRKLLSLLFSFSLIVYLVLFLLEQLFPGIVTTAFSLTYVLYPVLLFGILSALFPAIAPLTKMPTRLTPMDVWLAVGLSLLGAVLIYIKIDLTPLLRLVVACLSGILILTTSLLVIIPEGYHFARPRLSWRYLWILLAIFAVGIWGITRFSRSSPSIETSPTVIRLASSSYTIVLLNHSGQPSYLKSYQQLLTNNGYTTVKLDGADTWHEMTTTTLFFAEEDTAAANEIAAILRQSYGNVQLSPAALDTPPHTITVILGTPQAL